MTERRPENDCEVPLPLPTPAALPARPGEPCSPAPAPITVPRYAPTSEPAAPTEFVALGPVGISGGPVTVTCSEIVANSQFIGDPVTLSDGSILRQEFFWTEVPGITEAQLNYIARLPAEQRDPLGELYVVNGVVVSDTLDLSEISNRFQLLLSQAQAVQARVYELAIISWEATRGLALSLLDCFWYNEEQSATCVGNAIESFEGVTYAPSATIAAATFKSSVSLEEANSIALAAATSNLSCAWLNVEQVAICSEQDGLSGEQVSDYETDQAEFPAVEVFFEGETAEITRALSVTAAEGTILSTSSQRDANLRALIIAQLGLNCFFTETAEAHCVAEETVASEQSDVFTLTKGKNVVVPRGLLTSTQSKAEALDLATSLAESLLLCFWLNREVRYACDDKDSDPTQPLQVAKHRTSGLTPYPGPEERSNKDGVEIYATSLEHTIKMLASPLRSTSYAVTVEAGAFQSELSQIEADELAAVFALTQLACSYCNPRINPVCVPTDIDGYLPSPFPAESDPTTMELPLDVTLIDSTWSIDATAGVPGIVYVEGAAPGDPWIPNSGFFDETEESPVKTLLCSIDPFESVAVADIGGMVPIIRLSPASRNDNCQYSNDVFHAACREEDLAPVGGLSATNLIPTTAGYNEYFSYNSFPTGSYITIPAGSFTAASKVTANALAAVAAEAMLECFFESPELVVYCGATTDVVLPPVEAFHGLELVEIGSGVLHGDPVHVDSIGSEANGVGVAYGLGFSRDSPMTALLQALSIGMGQLDCFWKNEEQTAECDSLVWTVPAPHAVYMWTVAAGEVQSYDSQFAADQMALDLAEGRLNCIWINERCEGIDNCESPCVVARTFPIEQGTIVSTTSQDDANILAQILSAGLTQCVDLTGPNPCDPIPPPPYPGDGGAGGPDERSSGGSGSGSGECCTGIGIVIAAPTVLAYGSDDCFRNDGDPIWATVTVKVRVTGTGCKCVAWTAKVFVEDGRPLVGGSRWARGVEGYPFALDEYGSGRGSASFRIDDPEACKNYNIRVQVYPAGSHAAGSACKNTQAAPCEKTGTAEMLHFCDGGCGNSSSSSSSSSSAGSSSSSSKGSDKSTAIVSSSFTRDGFVALQVLEAPSVSFLDFVSFDLREKITMRQIDPQFMEVCEMESIAVAACTPIWPEAIGAEVIGNVIVIKRAGEGKQRVTLTLVGIRKGFAGHRWKNRNRMQFDANEAFINSAYPEIPEELDQT